MITAAPDTTLSDGRPVCVIRARELEPGDVWIELGRVDLVITSLSLHPLKENYVVAYYRIGASVITGERAKFSEAFVCIQPRVEAEGSAH